MITIASMTIESVRDEDCDEDGCSPPKCAPFVKDHVQTAEAIPTRKAEENEYPAKAASAPASAHSVAPAPEACCQKVEECGGPSRFGPKGSGDASSWAVCSGLSSSDRNDFAARLTNRAARTIVHSEFWRMKRARGASQIASSDVRRMRRRVSSLEVTGRIAHRTQTAAALARNTATTFSKAKPRISPGESVCTSGGWLTKEATRAAASSPPAGGSHLGNGLVADVPTKSKAFILTQPRRGADRTRTHSEQLTLFDTRIRGMVPHWRRTQDGG